MIIKPCKNNGDRFWQYIFIKVALSITLLSITLLLIGCTNKEKSISIEEPIFYKPYVIEIETTTEETTERTLEENEEVIEESVVTTEYESEEETFNQNDNAPYINANADFHYLCQMVRIEIGLGEGEEYYQACYMQAAVALNRVGSWANTLQEVLFMDGQFYGYGYDTWDWTQIGYDNPTLMQAVSDCMNYNDTPSNLVFADSWHDHEGTEIKEFYMEVYGQDFYLSK